MMKLILTEDVYNLGSSGEIVTVKPGYGRNYLLPRGLGMVANAANMRHLEHEKGVIANRQAKLKSAAEQEAGKLSAVAVKIARKVGEQEKLYGSVTSLDIAEALATQGHKVDRRHIHLPDPIKALGMFEVELRLHREVVSKLKVEVVALA